jgi:hypothetical protein
MGVSTEQRRSLKYIRLAAHLANQPTDLDRLVMTIEEIEGIVGEELPRMSRFPSWWRNDERRAHSRAWLTAGWRVDEIFRSDAEVVFVRNVENGARRLRST